MVIAGNYFFILLNIVQYIEGNDTLGNFNTSKASLKVGFGLSRPRKGVNEEKTFIDR
jgi:hypothetical protein